MSSKSIKVCFVPTCHNRSSTAPKKLFLSVPHASRESERCADWFRAIGKRQVTTTSAFCCEDHFNLSEDAKNWMFFKLAGQKLKLNTGVVPHRNLQENNIPKNYSQLTHINRIRKYKFSLKFATSADLQNQQVFRHLFILEEEFSENVSKACDSCVTDFCETFENDDEMSDSKDSVQLVLLSNFWPNENSMASSCQSSFTEFEQDSVMQNSCNSAPIFLMETKSRFYLGLPQKMYILIRCLSDNSYVYYKNILISFKKIICSEQYAHLAKDFNMSVSNVSRIFRTTVLKIADFMAQLLFWPEAPHFVQ